MADLTKKTYDVRDGRFSIEALEGGSGDTVLYLHGETGLHDGPFLQELASRYHVIAPRHPGFGASTGDDDLSDLWDLLYFYLDFLDAAGIDNAALIGHGLGGMFAAELAAMQPQRFTRLVLIAPFGLWDAANPTFDYFVGSPTEVASASFADPESDVAKQLALPGNEGDVKAILERVKGQRVAAKYLWPIPNRGFAKRAHRVRIPALVAWGERDGIIAPSYADLFVEALPDARKVSITNAAHFPQYEQASETASAVTGFLSA